MKTNVSLMKINVSLERTEFFTASILFMYKLKYSFSLFYVIETFESEKEFFT